MFGICAGAVAFYVSVSSFEVVNYLFADSKPVTASAIVTSGKKKYAVMVDTQSVVITPW